VVYPHHGILCSHKKEKLPTHAVTWKNSENIMPRERSQTQKANIVRFHLYEMSKIGRSIEIESSCCQGRGRKEE